MVSKSGSEVRINYVTSLSVHRHPPLTDESQMKQFRAHQTTREPQGRPAQQQPCGYPFSHGSESTGGAGGCPTSSLWGCRRGDTRTSSLKGLLLHLTLSRREPSAPGECGTCTHSWWSCSVYLFCLSSSLERSQIWVQEKPDEKRHRHLSSVYGGRVPGNTCPSSARGAQLSGFEVQQEMCGVGRMSRALFHRRRALKIKITWVGQV